METKLEKSEFDLMESRIMEILNSDFMTILTHTHTSDAQSLKNRAEELILIFNGFGIFSGVEIDRLKELKKEVADYNKLRRKGELLQDYLFSRRDSIKSCCKKFLDQYRPK